MSSRLIMDAVSDRTVTPFALRRSMLGGGDACRRKHTKHALIRLASEP